MPVALTGIGTMRANSTWKQTQNRGSQTGQEKRGNQPRAGPALHAPLPAPALPQAKGLSNREVQPPPRPARDPFQNGPGDANLGCGPSLQDLRANWKKVPLLGCCSAPGFAE